jgi:two-component sensor histidine kinase
MGFGSRLISRSVTGRLRGSLDYDWQTKGLVATLTVRKDRLAL